MTERPLDEDEISLALDVDGGKVLLDHDGLPDPLEGMDVSPCGWVSCDVASRAPTARRYRRFDYELQAGKRLPEVAGCDPRCGDDRDAGGVKISQIHLVDSPLEDRRRTHQDRDRRNRSHPLQVSGGADRKS